MRKKPLRLYFGVWIFVVTAFVSSVWIIAAQEPLEEHFSDQKVLCTSLNLTDFCFSTESRHSRHLSMPEWIAPFQDLPAFHDHFPSSSFFKPQFQAEPSK